MTDTATASVTATSTPSAPVLPPKPGWQTTEFYGTWAVKILGSLMATGVLGDGTMASRIIGGVMVILGLFGYQYSRTMIKTAAALLLFTTLFSPQISCTSAQRTQAAHALWNCLAPERVQAVDALTPLALSALQAAISADGKAVDSTKLKQFMSPSNLTTDAGLLLTCAVGSAVTIMMTQQGPASTGASPLVVDPRALQEAWRLVTPPGTRLHTRSGDLQ